MYPLKVRHSVYLWHVQRALTSSGTGKSRRRAATLGMLLDDVLLEIFDFCRRIVHDDYPFWPPPFTLYRIGAFWCTYVEDGDKSYSSLYTVSISEFSAHIGLLLVRISASDQPSLSFLSYSPRDAWSPRMNTMLLLPFSSRIVYALLDFIRPVHN